METATFVAPAQKRDFDGSTTVVIVAEAQRFAKLARLRLLKSTIAEQQREHDALQRELFPGDRIVLVDGEGSP